MHPFYHLFDAFCIQTISTQDSGFRSGTFLAFPDNQARDRLPKRNIVGKVFSKYSSQYLK